MTRVFTFLMVSLLTCSIVQAQDAVAGAAQEGELSLNEKASRLIAYSYFSQLAKQGAVLDLDQIREGARMAFANEEIGMTQEEIQSVGTAFDAKMREEILAKRKAASEKNIAEAETFFAENKTKAGVIALESGVQYKVIAEGEGPLATATDRVRLRYRGRLIDGTVFDETGDGPPADFAVSGVVRGMSEALQKMKVGGKIEAYLPSELAYGEIGPRDRRGMPIMNSPIGPHATLIFEMELIEIVKVDPAPQSGELPSKK